MRTVDVLLPEDDHGVIRVGNTRVTLETVFHHFQRGKTPEQIVRRGLQRRQADMDVVRNQDTDIASKGIDKPLRVG